MAGLEVVVRPVVLPNIRPAPARSLPPQDNPESGFCVIKGNGGHQIDLTYSFSMSMSKSVAVETERRVDEARVYEMDDDGTVNRDNFVDIQVANRIKSKGGEERDTGVDPNSGFVGTERVSNGKEEREEVAFYKPVQEKENIEVRKRNFILRSGKGFSE